MPKDSKMIVHIGYHKTGTTYLQNKIFPSIYGINYYGDKEYGNFLKSVLLKNSLEFDPKEVSASLDTSSTALYSKEALVGTMGLGTYNAEIAHRLARIGAERIIITIRNQPDMLEGIYRQYIQQGGVLKPKEFFQEDFQRFKWNYLDYYSLIHHYAEIFGKENMLIILHERLKHEQEAVLSEIANFLNTKAAEPIQNSASNRSLSSISIKMLRIINHFTYNSYRPSNLLSNKITTWKFRYMLQSFIDPYIVNKLFNNQPLVPKQYQKEANRIYVAGNDKLNKEFALHLQEYDYPLATTS